MRRLGFLLCVFAFASPAHARDARRRSSLTCALVAEPSSHAPAPREMVYAPAAIALDDLARVENRLVSYAERAQHLGSRVRPWLWVTPVMSGGIYGITVRVDR